MSLALFEAGPFVHAMGWMRPQDENAVAATSQAWANLHNPFDFDYTGGYWSVEEVPPACPSSIPLPVMRASGVARSRSAAKATVFAALLGKRLLAALFADRTCDGNQVGVAIASSSAITPIAWEFETVGVSKGWDKTDTMLLPSSIPSAIATQTSAVLDTHAVAVAFQDGAFGVCAAMEYAHLCLRQQRAEHFLVMAAEEICQIQCNALATLDDRRPWMDGATGLVLSKNRIATSDWQLRLAGNLVDDAHPCLPGEWSDATTLTIAFPSCATLFSAPLVHYALHRLLVNSSVHPTVERSVDPRVNLTVNPSVNATGKAVLICRLPGRGSYVLGFSQCVERA